MRIAFIRPGMSGRRSSDAMQPLVFAIIKSLTPADVELSFHDQLIEEVPENEAFDAVAMTVETFAARAAYELAARFRHRGVPVIMGGFHPSMVPDECAEHADAVVIGEAEDTWPVIVQDLRDGVLKPRYQSRNDADLRLRPDLTAFEGKRYLPVGLVQFSRGCRFTCEFCSIHAFYGHRIRTKPLPVLVQEIRSHQEKYLFFTDDNLFVDRESTRELCEALIPLKRRWFCQISMDVARDPELLRLLRRAGCRVVVIGFESLDPANLKQMKKGANLLAPDYDRVIGNLYRAGLMIYGTFVIGYDHDTATTPDALVDFAVKYRFLIANFNPLTPMPGTRLYDRLLTSGKLTHERWWTDGNYRYGDAMLLPQGMTPQELTAGCQRARFGFYSRSNIARRLAGRANLATPQHAFIYALANLVSRREVRSKQGRSL